MSRFSNKLYEFGSFRLDAAERVLWRGEELIVLPPKVFDTLLTLLEKAGGVVSKSELMQTVWADTFVEESNMSQNIYTLRRTLGVDEQGRQFIETVPRRGYRFAVPVRLSGDAANDSAKPTAEVISDPATTTAEGKLFADALPSAAVSPVTNEAQPVTMTQTFMSSTPEQIRPHSVWQNVFVAGLGILLLLALSFGVYQFILRRGATNEPKTAPIEQLRFQRLTDSGDVFFSTLSPNGELLAYVRLEEEQASVWVKQIATGSAIQTLPPSRKGYRSLVISPDGRYLYFREEADPGNIYQTSVFGSAPKKVAANVWSDFSISPDGSQCAFIRRDTGRNASVLMLSNLDGSGEHELRVRDAPLSYSGAPVWSPDSTKLVVAADVQKQVHLNLVTIDASTGKETTLQTPRWRAISRLSWMPNGKQLIVTAREINESTSQLWMLGFPDGAVRRLTNDLEGYFWVSLSADGRMLVTRQQKIISQLWLLPDGDLKQAKQLTFGERSLDGYVGLAWTPDGKIIFSAFANNTTDLYSMNTDGSNRVPLTINAGQDNTYPVISADGRYLVFISSRTGIRQLWRMDRDGRNQKQLTFDEAQKGRGQAVALSADGTEVFFVKIGASPTAIWKIPIDGGSDVPVAQLANATTEGFLSGSPDGKWLAYRHVFAQPEARSETPTLRIGVLPTDGNAEPKLFDLPMRRAIIQWSADATAFYYAAGVFNTSSLWRQPLNGDKPQKLLDFPDRVFNFAWSHDGKNLVIARGRLQSDAILITNLP